MQSIASLKKSAPIVALLLLIMALVVVAGQPARAQDSDPDPADPAGVATGGTYLPFVMNQMDHIPPLSIFGVQTYEDTLSNNPYMPYAAEVGASWVRVPVHWKSAEPSNVAPAEFQWSDTDKRLGAGLRNRPRVIATIDFAPDWAAPSPFAPFYEGMYDDFAQYVGALVERYDGDGINDAPGSPVVTHWEFYNEPDSAIDSGVPGWGDNGAEYAYMLETAGAALKAANPDAKVVFGGVAHDFFEEDGGRFVRSFVDDVLAAGGGNHFDIMSFHVYPSFSRRWADYGPGLLQKAQAIRAKLADHGLQKPMVVTEAGWHSDNQPEFPSTPEIQARYVVQFFTQSMAADLDLMIWWTLYDPGGYSLENGLVTGDNPPQRKKSFYAYQTIVDKLGAAEYDGALLPAQTGAEAMEAYRFNLTEKGTTIYVAWLNPINGGATHPLQIDAAEAMVYDMYGDGSLVNDVDDGTADGKITVPIGGQPVYVEVLQ